MLTELESLIILNAIAGLGNGGIHKLIRRFGSARAVMNLNESELLRDRLVTPAVAGLIAATDHTPYLKREMALIQKHSVTLLDLSHESYPQNLKTIADAPVLLYVKGNIPANIELSLAVVGSRNASVYGLNHARKFAMQLADLNFCVVSGMARGVDTAAHQGALKAGGTTVAVLGSGLANIYPKENRNLYEAIAERGCVISEFAMTMPPIAHNFPRRNRIISGLSMGVIVIEAARRSGALITCDFALEQGKEVFALPGKIDHPNAAGTNDLIRQGAKLVMGLDDVLEEFKEYLGAMRVQSENYSGRRAAAGLSGYEGLLEHIGERPVHIDHLALLVNRPVPEISSKLLGLELQGKIKQLPGKLFTRSN